METEAIVCIICNSPSHGLDNSTFDDSSSCRTFVNSRSQVDATLSCQRAILQTRYPHQADEKNIFSNTKVMSIFAFLLFMIASQADAFLTECPYLPTELPCGYACTNSCIAPYAGFECQTCSFLQSIGSGIACTECVSLAD
jgi:hypothetical protein